MMSATWLSSPSRVLPSPLTKRTSSQPASVSASRISADRMATARASWRWCRRCRRGASTSTSEYSSRPDSNAATRLAWSTVHSARAVSR
ncbi:hypothetical protein D3C72_1810680 [compost metagenome]